MIKVGDLRTLSNSTLPGCRGCIVGSPCSDQFEVCEEEDKEAMVDKNELSGDLVPTFPLSDS